VFDNAVLYRRSIERSFRSGATHREVLAVANVEERYGGEPMQTGCRHVAVVSRGIR
jgi:hypothetical protein